MKQVAFTRIQTLVTVLELDDAEYDALVEAQNKTQFIFESERGRSILWEDVDEQAINDGISSPGFVTYNVATKDEIEEAILQNDTGITIEELNEALINAEKLT